VHPAGGDDAAEIAGAHLRLDEVLGAAGDAQQRVVAEVLFIEEKHEHAAGTLRCQLAGGAGRALRGVVKRTFLRGEMIYDRAALTGAPRGERLRGATS